eukprot:gene6774-9278_t
MEHSIIKGITFGLILICLGVAILWKHIDLNWFISLNEYLESAAIPLWYVAKISILDFAGSILCCTRFRRDITINKAKKSWIETLVVCTLYQFGGTTLTGLLLGQTPSWIMSKTAFPALLLAWWLIFFCPFDLFSKYVCSNTVVMHCVNILSTISSSHAVGSWGVDKAMFNSFHVNAADIRKSSLVCIFCGMLSASGGGLLYDWLGFNRNPSFAITETPSIFVINKRNASSTINRAFLLATLYYYLVDINNILSLSTEYLSERRKTGLKSTTDILFKISGPILNIALQFSAYQTGMMIVRLKSTKELSSFPFFSLLANSWIWATYGLLRYEPSIYLSCAMGIFIGAFCIGSYSSYCKHSIPIYYFIGLAITMLITTTLAVTSNTHIIGLLGCFISVVLSGSPLTVIRTVIETRNTSALPFLTSLILWLNNLSWIGYGLELTQDPFIYIPNFIGLIFSTTQIALFVKYGIQSPKN